MSATENKSVEITRGINGLEKVTLREIHGSSVEISYLGTQISLDFSVIHAYNGLLAGNYNGLFRSISVHVTSWKNEQGEELVFVSRPGGDLMLTSRIRNTNADGKPFTFTFAYFSVSDISEVRVEGLETLDYLDNMKNRERYTEQGDAITFESEVDKIYLTTPTKIAILDHEKKRTFGKMDFLMLIRSVQNFPCLQQYRCIGSISNRIVFFSSVSVVWNPWDKKAKSIADFGDDKYKHMLCVEAAAIEKPITLKPGEEWKVRQELSAVP
ncbi:hypothetical protein L1987_41052 [Smallanthus sonchifolius]|uniref:Uncharacterized protein n=1 Tax=Smallanthus sonchifolius TaxID=185202 RepID=A0ACB9GU39_9ASTR|nr:hypothetical protein L1987_41052 [Smallanthus sonchifolius]